MIIDFILFYFILFYFIVRERERNTDVRNINQLPPVHAPTGNQTCNLGLCPDQRWNPQPFGVQDHTPTN